MRSMSFSSFEVFKQCPYRFKLEYIDRVDVYKVEYPATKKGKNFHEAMARIFDLYKDEQKDYEKIVTYVMMDYDLPEYLQKAPLEPEIRDIIEEAIKFDGHAEYEIAIKQNEDGFEITSFDDPQATFRGIADLWYYADDIDVLNIIDWKTGKSGEFLYHLDQLEFYAFLFKSAFPQYRDKVISMNYVHILPDNLVNVFEQVISPEKVKYKDLVNKWMDKLNRIINEKEFKPHAGVWCMFCPVAHHCPIEDQITTRDPKKLLEIYYKSKAAHENAKGLLMQILEEVDNLEFEDAVVELKQVRKPYVNQNAFRKLLKHSDIELDDIIDFISISPSGAKVLGIDKDIVNYRSYKQIWNKKKRG